MTLQCLANFLHCWQSENIGSPDGDPIKITKSVGKMNHHIPNEVKSLILCLVLLLGSSVKKEELLC